MKNKLLDKIIKKNYNNELEEVLSDKFYAEDVKNLLLDILYKIDNAYDDYKTVKVDACSREEYVQNLIKIIKNKCNKIEFFETNEQENAENTTVIIDKENKKIKCYPIERKLLYALSKIQKKENIVKTDDEILNKAFTNLLNIGNCINMVEPYRDFNGFSWNISTLEIENIPINIIYQDLLILVGNDFLEDWINNNDDITNYMEIFKEKLEKRFGNDLTIEIITILQRLSILLEIYLYPSRKNVIKKRFKNIQEKIELIKNKKDFLDKVYNDKRQLEEQIRKLDIIINDPQKLKNEYEKMQGIYKGKNITLKVLSSKMKKERNKKLEQIHEYNNLVNPKNFIIYNEKIKLQYKYLKVINEKDIQEKIKEELINLQINVLHCLLKKINNSTNKIELIKILYEYRYYQAIPFSLDKQIENIVHLSKYRDLVIEEFVKKAIEFKAINKMFKDSKIYYELIKKVCLLKTISLNDIYCAFLNENDELYIEFFDENVLEEKCKMNLEYNKNDFIIKLNKKVKLFTL